VQMATTHIATCCCGQLSLSYKGEITRTAMCHCTACQKRTGSAFGLQFAVKRESAVIRGLSTRYTRIADTGTKLDFHFCPTCGSTVFWEMGDVPDIYAVAAGCFADASLPSPSISVYSCRKHHWFELPSSVQTIWQTQDE
jgi:hypothetical protein